MKCSELWVFKSKSVIAFRTTFVRSCIFSVNIFFTFKNATSRICRRQYNSQLMVVVIKAKGKEEDLAANALPWDSADFNDVLMIPRPPSDLKEASHKADLGPSCP